MLGPAKEYLALYTITAKNKTSQWLSGVKITHGPLPRDSQFDPARSTSGCVSAGGGVECAVNLGPDESKPVTVAYRVKNSISCLLARALQSAKTTVNRLTGGAETAGSEQVTTTVSCSMESASSVAGSENQGAGRTAMGGGRGTAGTPGFGTRGWGGVTGAGPGGVAAGTGGAYGAGRFPAVRGAGGGGVQAAGVNGYRISGNTVGMSEQLPRTGANAEYFSRIESKSNFVLIPRPAVPQGAGLGVISTVSLGLVVALVVAILLRRIFCLQQA